MRNLKIVLLVIFSLFISGMKGVKAYEFPSDANYITIRESYLGTVTIYLPSDQVEVLAIDENNQLVNTSSSSVYGYFSYSGRNYRITFSTFNYGTYTLYGQSSRTLNIEEVIETNAIFLDNATSALHFNSDMIQSASLIFIGGVLCLIWLRRY